MEEYQLASKMQEEEWSPMHNPAKRRSLTGWVLLVTAFLTCPCHLLLVAAVLAGTALGGVLREYFPVILPLTVLYFVVALFVGLKLLTPTGTTQSTEATPGASGDGPSPHTPEVRRKSRMAGIKP